MTPFTRKNGRAVDQLRPVSIQFGVYPYAAGSALYSVGNTRVLCSVTLQPGVPSFLRGTKTGWLTAQYAMLPASTHKRIDRETGAKRTGRFIEISRLIGRSLRSAVDLSGIGERTIIIDCDVLQADGGTRTACITAAFFALQQAQQRWLYKEWIRTPVVKYQVAAVSVGLYEGVPVLDPDCKEDSTGQADVNFVLTKSGDIIELQGTAETAPCSWKSFNAMYALASKGVSDILEQIKAPKSAPRKNGYAFGSLGSILKSKTP